MIYAEAGSNKGCAVKIVKRGKVWAVYPLEKMSCRKEASVTGSRLIGCRFTWERRARETYKYSPVEAKDSYQSPIPLISHIARMCNHKVQVRTAWEK